MADFKTAGELLPSLCIDIETCHASEEAIQDELDLWKPRSNWKPETIEANRIKKAETIKNKSALLDSAPIATVGVCDEDAGVTVFHWLKLESGMQEGFRSEQCADEKEMLIGYREFSDKMTDSETALVGFNLGFDLPHLRIAYIRHNLKLPNHLIPRSGNPIADVQYLFGKYFTSKNGAEFSLGLDETVKRLGIAPEGKQMKGADVPVYVAKGFKAKGKTSKAHEEVIIYNAIDVLLTMRAFLLCTGMSGE